MSEFRLVKYDAACRALAEARSVDEVKDIIDKTIAMACYARQAKNKNLEADANEIRMRAERRLGELMDEQKETVGFNTGAKGVGFSKTRTPEEPPTLAEAGIDKNLAHRARTLGGYPRRVTRGRRRTRASGFQKTRCYSDLGRGRDRQEPGAPRPGTTRGKKNPTSPAHTVNGPGFQKTRSINPAMLAQTGIDKKFACGPSGGWAR